jgi:hypothetical protein
MEHWREVLTLPIYEIQYEDFIKDYTSTIPKLIDFCRLEWEDSCLQFYEKADEAYTSSRHQVRKPIYTDSIGKHKKYIQHLEPLIRILESP